MPGTLCAARLSQMPMSPGRRFLAGVLIRQWNGVAEFVVLPDAIRAGLRCCTFSRDRVNPSRDPISPSEPQRFGQRDRR